MIYSCPIIKQSHTTLQRKASLTTCSLCEPDLWCLTPCSLCEPDLWWWWYSQLPASNVTWWSCLGPRVVVVPCRARVVELCMCWRPRSASFSSELRPLLLCPPLEIQFNDFCKLQCYYTKRFEVSTKLGQCNALILSRPQLLVTVVQTGLFKMH